MFSRILSRGVVYWQYSVIRVSLRCRYDFPQPSYNYSFVRVSFKLCLSIFMLSIVFFFFLNKYLCHWINLETIFEIKKNQRRTSNHKVINFNILTLKKWLWKVNLLCSWFIQHYGTLLIDLKHSTNIFFLKSILKDNSIKKLYVFKIYVSTSVQVYACNLDFITGYQNVKIRNIFTCVQNSTNNFEKTRFVIL